MLERVSRSARCATVQGSKFGRVPLSASYASNSCACLRQRTQPPTITRACASSSRSSPPPHRVSLGSLGMYFTLRELLGHLWLNAFVGDREFSLRSPPPPGPSDAC